VTMHVFDKIQIQEEKIFNIKRK